MNYVFYLLEIVIVYLLMILFYKIGKKDGLYVYICLLSSIISFTIFGTIDILSFQVNLGIPILLGIFMANNIIIQRYGIDEVKRILLTCCLSYVGTAILISFASLINNYSFDYFMASTYDLLFGYDLNNLRCTIASGISIIIMLWLGSGIYFSIRKSKNILFVSNIVSVFVVAFIESLIFILISNVGNFSAIELFGMISVRYIVEVALGIIGLIILVYK